MTTPAIVPAPTPHRSAATQGIVALVAIAGFVASMVAFGGTHFPVQTAAITAAVLPALAFARKEAPWVRQLLIWARALRKNKAVTSSAPYRELEAKIAALTSAVPAPVAAAVEVAVHDVVAAVEAPPSSAPAAPATTPVAPPAVPAAPANDILRSLGIG